MRADRASLDMDAAVVVAAAPLRDARRRVGFVSQLEAGALVAVLDGRAARGRAVDDMQDERTAAGAVWRR